MKKLFMAITVLMASVSVYAQVDSTTVDTTAVASPTDSASQAAVNVDSTSTTTVASADSAEITDEDLKNYAIAMDSVEGMKKALLAKISTKIKSNSKMKISRYNQLSKAADDEAKLQELKATPQEIAFVKEISEMKKQGAEEISNEVEKLANDFVGVEKYNKIKDTLPLDTQLKMRYDRVVSETQKAEEGTASAK
jgi:hypothetical protein